MIRPARPSSIRGLIGSSLLGLFIAGTIAEETVGSKVYTSPNGMFSVRVPKPPNLDGAPYTITPLDNRGDKQYDKVMFQISDSGTYLVASSRVVPVASVSLMDKGDHRTVLRNISEASLHGWRTDLVETPEVTRESFVDSKYGEAIVRIYRAKKGSLLADSRGSGVDPGVHFDTNIASMVARQGAMVVYVLAQDDSRADDAQAVSRMATEFFDEITVLKQGKDPNTTDAYGETPIMVAARKGNVELVALLLDGGADLNTRARCCSVSVGSTLETLRPDEVSPESIDATVKTKGCQIIGGNTVLMEAAVYNRSRVVQLLLERGADPNLGSPGGATALMHAAIQRNVEEVRLLLEHGAHVNALDRCGKSALDRAEKRGGNEAVAKLLRDAAGRR